MAELNAQITKINHNDVDVKPPTKERAGPEVITPLAQPRTVNELVAQSLCSSSERFSMAIPEASLSKEIDTVEKKNRKAGLNPFGSTD